VEGSQPVTTRVTLVEMLVLLLVCLAPSLLEGQREQLVINRRARQRVSHRRLTPQPETLEETQSYSYSGARSSEGYGDTILETGQERGTSVDQATRLRTRGETALTVYSDYSARDSAGVSSEYSSSRPVQYSESSYSDRTISRRARLPRARRRGGGDTINLVEGVSKEEQPRPLATRSRSRSRSRIRGSPSHVTSAPSQQELSRDERGSQESTHVPTRTRSRTRYRAPRPNVVSTETARNTKSFKEQKESRVTGRTRGKVRGQDGGERRFSSSRYRGVEASLSGRPQKASRAQRPPKEARSQSSSGPRIKFPKLNLFADHPKIKSSPVRENSVNTARTDAKPIRGRSRGDQIRPTRPTRPVGPSYQSVDYQVQSGRNEDTESEVPTEITVTHQVPSRTVFTVVEAGETKSLFADTFISSLEIIPVTDLHSTEIESNRVVYAHVKTNVPSFGVTELEFEAIQPTRTYREEERSLFVGGEEKTITESIPFTVYNVETMTARTTETPSLNVNNGALSALGEHGQLGALLQNVLLSILGGNLLGRGVGPTIQEPRTQYITHTRSFLTETTSMETIVVPINFRGSKIYETVTDLKTSLITTTDLSVQTVLNYDRASSPFLPLAPTLHRAARVVPASPPPYNIPILYTEAPVLQTSLLTQTNVVTSTVTTFTTSQLLLTLGGREITTEIVEPHTEVVTSTVLHTEPVFVAEEKTSSDRTMRQLQLLQALLKLRS